MSARNTVPLDFGKRSPKAWTLKMCGCIKNLSSQVPQISSRERARSPNLGKIGLILAQVEAHKDILRCRCYTQTDQNST